MKLSPEDVLSRYPGPIELEPQRLRWQIMLGVSVACMGVGFALMFSGHRAGLWIVLAFGVLAALPAMVALPGAAKLVLDRDGFRATSLYRGRYVRWDESSDFHVAKMERGGYRIVVYEDPGMNENRVLSKSRFAGYNSAFPDSYGFDVDELADLMNRWRKKSLDSQL